MTTKQAPEPCDERLWKLYEAQPDSHLREQLIDRYRCLAYAVLRHVGRSSDEDAEQVALMALVNAADRFDPSSGHCFTSFAFPSILGQVRRYLREQTHVLRPSRSLLNRRAAVFSRQSRLTAELGRPPTVSEIAEAMGLEADRVHEVMALEETCHPRSLDGLQDSLDHERPLQMAECLGEEDPELEKVEEHIAWTQALAKLDPRLRTIIRLRYYQNLSQEEAAHRLGISQMHVSRLERRALKQLRGQMTSTGRAAVTTPGRASTRGCAPRRARREGEIIVKKSASAGLE